MEKERVKNPIKKKEKTSFQKPFLNSHSIPWKKRPEWGGPLSRPQEDKPGKGGPAQKLHNLVGFRESLWEKYLSDAVYLSPTIHPGRKSEKQFRRGGNLRR